MSEIIFLVSPSAEGGYEARALGHSIFTEADDLDALRQQIQDAIACHFEPSERPRLVRSHIVHPASPVRDHNAPD